MPIGNIQTLLKKYAEHHAPQWFGSGDSPNASSDVQGELMEEYDSASPVADYLCFPIRVHYDAGGGYEGLISVDLRGIRKAAGRYLFLVDTDAYGHPIVLDSTRIKELYAGQDGTLYTSEEQLTDPVERAAFALSNKIWRGTKYEVNYDGIAPSLRQFVDRFDLFSGDTYLKLRQKLHILLFLARADGRACKEEHKAVLKFVYAEVGEDEPQITDILAYLSHAFVTVAIFEEAVDAMDSMAMAEIKDLIEMAEALIAADGAITPDERELFDKLQMELH